MSITTVKITKKKLDQINNLCKTEEVANRISDEVTSTIALHMLDNKGICIAAVTSQVQYYLLYHTLRI